MQKKLLAFIIIIFCLGLFLGLVTQTQAQGFDQGLQQTITATSNLPKKSLQQAAVSATQAFLGLIGIIFVVLIIYSGFTWMTAMGEESKITTARKIMTTAVVGIIIIIFGQVITLFIAGQLEQPGQGVGTTVAAVCQDPQKPEYYSSNCCDARFVKQGVEEQCCVSNTIYCTAHKTSCDPFLTTAPDGTTKLCP